MEYTIYEILLNFVRKRPGMYFGDETLFSLSKFIAGYNFATHLHKLENPIPPFMEFNRWIEKKYNVTSTIGWYEIILYENGGDEKRALDSFFKLLEEFISSY